ncbi:MAG TPA: pitrilysin family protein, partial [Gemmatimonadaceae bacterium]|nr:pitrilysin family protein [Gemmatimonadaceae bacterium]
VPAPAAAAPVADTTPPALPTTPPTLAPPPTLALPPIETRQLANGMKLVVVEQHELPVVDFVLLVRTGSEADPIGRSGLASLTADMLDEGTTTRNALQVADQEAYLGVALGTGSGWDASQVVLHTTTAQLDSALALFADVALHPSFAASDFARVKQQRLTELVQVKDHAPAIADRAFAAIVYGPRHPYGHAPTGTESSVRAITRRDIQRFYDTYYRPNNATLIVVGDITAADAERRVSARFGDWQREPVPPTTYGATPRKSATTLYLIDKPGAAQSSIRIGGVGVPRATSDYFALQVMNTILGGSFTSRLNQNLRETHGYTYGAFSGFSMRHEAGPFTARAEVVAAKTDSAMVEFLKELRAIRDTVPSAELQKAKRYLELQLPGDFESTGDIARQLVPVALYDLPLDFYDGYVQHLEGVSQTEVQRVARRYVEPDSMTVVIVGDRRTIESGLRALDLGPVSLRNLEGEAAQP